MRETVCIRSLGSFPHLGPLRTSHLWKLSLLGTLLAPPASVPQTCLVLSRTSARNARSTADKQAGFYLMTGDSCKLVRKEFRSLASQSFRLLMTKTGSSCFWVLKGWGSLWLTAPLQALLKHPSLYFVVFNLAVCKLCSSRCICPNMWLHGNQPESVIALFEQGQRF